MRTSLRTFALRLCCSSTRRRPTISPAWNSCAGEHGCSSSSAPARANRNNDNNNKSTNENHIRNNTKPWNSYNSTHIPHTYIKIYIKNGCNSFLANTRFIHMIACTGTRSTSTCNLIADSGIILSSGSTALSTMTDVTRLNRRWSARNQILLISYWQNKIPSKMLDCWLRLRWSRYKWTNRVVIIRQNLDRCNEKISISISNKTSTNMMRDIRALSQAIGSKRGRLFAFINSHDKNHEHNGCQKKCKQNLQESSMFSLKHGIFHSLLTTTGGLRGDPSPASVLQRAEAIRLQNFIQKLSLNYHGIAKA